MFRSGGSHGVWCACLFPSLDRPFLTCSHSFGIAPWNAGPALAFRAISCAILCGNTVVLKASEVTPRTHAVVAELFEEAGLPKGVLNFLSISREASPELVSKIIAHPLVRHVNVSLSSEDLFFSTHDLSSRAVTE